MGLANMNKDDLRLVSIILIMGIIFLGIFKLLNSDKPKEALVYYQNELVLTIDMTSDSNNTYKVMGKNGEITIIYEPFKVKVVKETSPLHLCSKQGWISKSYETIVCLPNEVVIKINDINQLDTVVK